MKLAYLILVHNNPGQLNRLVRKLTDAEADIYIHVDKKADEYLFKKELAIPGVFFVKKREKVNWGGYSIVKATLNGLYEIANAGIEYGYVTLLSGQDYPLKPNNEIRQFFTGQKGNAFMSYESVDGEWTEAQPRLQNYFLTDYVFPGSTRVEGLINSILPKRKRPKGLVFVGRSQWFSITLRQVKYILSKLEEEPGLERFFRYTWGSDEFVFQTLLYNSPFKDDMVNNNLRYTDWSAGGASPKVLTLNDYERLLASPALFARKFDEGIDGAILDRLDAVTR